MPDVGDDADDAAAAVLREHVPHGVSTRPERACERLVHYRDRLARRAIVLRESAAAPQGDAGRLEISVAHDAHERLRRLAGPIDLTLGSNLPSAIAAEREDIRQTGSQHAMDRPRPAQQIVDERVLLWEAGEPKAGIDPKRGRLFRSKAQVHVQQAGEASHQETGADDKHAREGDLQNDKRAPRPRLSRTPRYHTAHRQRAAGGEFA